MFFLAQLDMEGNPNPEVFTRPGVEHVRVFENPFFHKVRALLLNRRSVSMTDQDLQHDLEHYMDNPVIKRAHAFVCAFPAALCELGAMFNKSIVVDSAHRFNMARCHPPEFNRWHNTLINIAKDRKNVIGAMSRYDLEYLNYYLNLPNSMFLPSLTGFYTKGNVFEPTQKDILIYQA